MPPEPPDDIVISEKGVLAPEVSLIEALVIVKVHIKQKEIDLSTYHVKSIKLTHDSKTYKKYWEVYVHPNDIYIGHSGEMKFHIDMNEKIKQVDTEEDKLGIR